MIKQIQKSKELFEEGWNHWISLAEPKVGVNFNAFKNGMKSWHIQQQTALLESVKKWAVENKKLEAENHDPVYSKCNICDARVYNKALEDLINYIDKQIKESK